jgi:hypothetical protein
MPELDQALHPSGPWLGGEMATYVRLPTAGGAWFFGDSLWASDQAGRANAHIVHSAALVFGPELGAPPVHHAGKPPAGALPHHPSGWSWPIAALPSPDAPTLLLQQVENHPLRPNAQVRGVGIARLDNPHAPPQQWSWTLEDLEPLNDSQGVAWGAAALVHEGWLYVYGSVLAPDGNLERRWLTVARTAWPHSGSGAAWQLEREDGSFGAFDEPPGRLFPGAAAELTVTYHPPTKRFLAVYSEDGLGPQVLVRAASSPQGPFGPPQAIYDCPEARAHASAWCYGARHQPALATAPHELVFSYVANSPSIAEVRANDTLFRTRFARADLRKLDLELGE